MLQSVKVSLMMKMHLHVMRMTGCLLREFRTLLLKEVTTSIYDRLVNDKIMISL